MLRHSNCLELCTQYQKTGGGGTQGTSRDRDYTPRDARRSHHTLIAMGPEGPRDSCSSSRSSQRLLRCASGPQHSGFCWPSSTGKEVVAENLLRLYAPSSFQAVFFKPYNKVWKGANGIRYPQKGDRGKLTESQEKG